MSAAEMAGFFTLGVSADRYHLPHPRIGLPIVFVIRRVLLRAFEMLRERNFNLADAKEDEVTAALRSVVENDLRKTGVVHGFDHRTYESVHRQGQVANYDGTSLGKSPDLCFKLRHDDFASRSVISEFDALFVECKPVDRSHGAGSKYCDEGVIRFVSGDYAWAMQEGMMLAYVRHGRSIAHHLIPAMKEPARTATLGTVQHPEPCEAAGAPASGEAETVHISEHRRGLEWPDEKGPACNITIYHLWYCCD